ncbi:MAG: (Fe-S)-binding protein [Syntrophaceae bacterium]|nr:(Fe-S)-binding protein [Syntrophaceae bacterium]
MNKAPDNTLLLRAQRQVASCDRCGACLPVCPLFGARDVESSSARGKNALTRALADGVIEADSGVLAAANFCLLCRTCVEVCPNQVPTDEAMVDVRQYLMNRTRSLNAQYRVVGGFLKSLGLVKTAAAVLAFLRRVGLNRLFPYGMAPDEYTRSHYLAAFAGPAALGQPVDLAPKEIKAGAKIAYFYGCGMRMMFPAAAADTLRILSTITSPLIKDNVCCGLPHLAHSLRDDFLALARKNIRLYEDADLIVSDCASCAGTLKHLATWFADDPRWQEQAASFSAKVMDISEYLVKAGYTPQRKAEVTLTYHDPCHLVRGQGISKQPRDLLGAVGTFVEMDQADLCCGGAGSFHMDYPAISAKIVDRKRANIEKSGASIVVTGCPGCLIQLTKAARASGGRFQAMHLSQVI